MARKQGTDIDKLISFFKDEQKSDKETIRSLHESNAALQDTINALNKTVEELQQSVNDSGELIASLNETIRKMQQTIDSLNQKIALLEEQKNKNSRNSSKPPSSDGYSKPKSLRKSGGKKGAPNGHPGNNLAINRKPDEIISHMPKGCEQCPRYKECLAAAKVCETRNEVDAEVKITLIQHNVLEVDCPMHQDHRQGEFPADLNAFVQYGPNVTALAVALNTVGAVSLSRASDILRGVFGIPITPATVGSMVHRVSLKTDEPLQQTKDGLKASPLLHGDETGFRVEGKLHWVHVLCNGMFTHLSLSTKRGWKGMEEAGLLPRCHGTLTHDFWASYWHYGNFVHNVCRAHLLRELQGVTDNHPGQTWAKDFADLLLDMKKSQEKALLKGKSELSFSTRYRFGKRYDEIIERAYQENPEPKPVGEKKRGRKKRGKVLSLIDRLRDYKASVCLIITDLTVPFDNNQAERDLRMHKSKIKVSGCFRTREGAEDYLKIMSCVSTGRKHGHNGYDVIMNLISGSLDFMVAG